MTNTVIANNTNDKNLDSYDWFFDQWEAGIWTWEELEDQLFANGYYDVLFAED